MFRKLLPSIVLGLMMLRRGPLAAPIVSWDGVPLPSDDILPTRRRNCRKRDNGAAFGSGGMGRHSQNTILLVDSGRVGSARAEVVYAVGENPYSECANMAASGWARRGGGRLKCWVPTFRNFEMTESGGLRLYTGARDSVVTRR